MKKTLNNKKIFGKELVIDLFDCDIEIISSKKKLKEFIVKICQLIKMKRYGEPFIEKFGLSKDFTVGYSIVQLIETSSITGHFSEFWKSSYINIFSCKNFSEKKATAFTKKFFKAKRMKVKTLIR
jgi:S-adenosylmethionine decarboxylase